MGKLTHTVSGNPVSFLSADDADIDSMKINFLPVQPGTGDPSSSNVRPITGFSGVTAYRTNKNILLPSKLNFVNSVEVSGVKFTLNDDGSISAKGTSSAAAQVGISLTGLYDGNYYICDTQANYTGSGSAQNAGDMYVWNNTTNARCKKWDGTTSCGSVSSLSGYEQVKLNKTDNIYMLMRIYNGKTVDATFRPMLVPATETDFTYESYLNNSSFTVTFPALNKNLFNSTLQVGSFAIVSGEEQDSGTRVRCGYIYITAGTYTVSNAENRQVVMYYYDEGKTYHRDKSQTAWIDSPFSFTTSENCYVRFAWRKGTDNPSMAVTDISKIQLESGSSATDFIPFTNTAYGGTLDMATGLLTVTHYGFDPQYCPDIVLDSTTSSVTVGRIKFDTNHFSLSKNDNCIVSNRFSSALPRGTVGRMAMLSQANIYYVMTTSELATIDHAGFVQWFKDHPTVFVYELNTPKTIQLIEQNVKALRSRNVVWSNTNADAEITYCFVDYLSKRRMFIGERMILPPEYQKTDYIQSNGSNARMSTGVPGDDTTLKITGEFVITEATGSYEGVFGNYKSESADCCWRIIFKANSASDYSSSFWVTPGSGAPSGTYGVTAGMSPVNSGETFINVRILFDMEYGKCTLIGTKTHSVNFSTKAANANSNPIAIGGSNVSATGGGKKIKYYKFSIKSHGVLIREYIPCYRKSDNKAGFYDLVNHTFNPSIGTVEFIAGNDT